MKPMVITVKKVLRMIDSCQDQEQIDNCRIVIQNYVKSAEKKGLSNVTDLKKRLDDELFQKQEEIMLVRIFNDRI